MEHLEEVEAIVGELDAEDAVSIMECKENLLSDTLRSSLVFVQCNLSFLPDSITSLETAGLPLLDALQIVSEVKSKIEEVLGELGLIFQSKVGALWQKNPGLSIL